jgi:hypothetical protein
MLTEGKFSNGVNVSELLTFVSANYKWKKKTVLRVKDLRRFSSDSRSKNIT